MAGEKNSSAPSARGDEPRAFGAFCVPVSGDEPLYIESPGRLFTPPPGHITFQLGDGTEVLRLEEGGTSYVYGKLVEDDVEAATWRALKEFLAKGSL